MAMSIWLTTRRWKRIAIGLAILVAIVLIVNGVLAWRAEWQLSSRLAKIRAAGDSASIAELAPKPIPDGENAAATLQQITPRLDEFSKEYAQFSLSPIGEAYDEANDRGEPATPEQLDVIRTILGKYPDVEQRLAATARQDQYASRMDFSLGHQAFIDALIKSQGPPRTAARFLNWRIEVLLAEGEREQAVERGIQVLRLARLYESEPTMVAFLVAIAMRGMAIQQMYDALAAGPISSELHAKLDAELARLDDPQTLVRVLKTERAISADWVYGHVGGWYGALAHVVGWPMKSFQVGVLDMMEEYIQLAEQPWHEVRGRFGTSEHATATHRPRKDGRLADARSKGRVSGQRPQHGRDESIANSQRDARVCRKEWPRSNRRGRARFAQAGDNRSLLGPAIEAQALRRWLGDLFRDGERRRRRRGFQRSQGLRRRTAQAAAHGVKRGISP